MHEYLILASHLEQSLAYFTHKSAHPHSLSLAWNVRYPAGRPALVVHSVGLCEKCCCVTCAMAVPKKRQIQMRLCGLKLHHHARAVLKVCEGIRFIHESGVVFAKMLPMNGGTD